MDMLPVRCYRFWSEPGFVFGEFPFVGWSRGWYAEDKRIIMRI